MNVKSIYLGSVSFNFRFQVMDLGLMGFRFLVSDFESSKFISFTLMTLNLYIFWIHRFSISKVCVYDLIGLWAYIFLVYGIMIPPVYTFIDFGVYESEHFMIMSLGL